jgi:hypothetical protein
MDSKVLLLNWLKGMVMVMQEDSKDFDANNAKVELWLTEMDMAIGLESASFEILCGCL